MVPSEDSVDEMVWQQGTGSDFFYKEITGNYGTFDDDGEYQFNDAYYDRAYEELTTAEKRNLQTESDYTDWSSIGIFGFGASSSSSSRTSPETIWAFQQQDYQKFKNAYNTESYKAYDSAYQEAFNTVMTKSSLNMSESTDSGLIKGTFKSNSDIVTSIGTAAQLDAIASSALTTANATTDSVGGTSWTAAFNTAYEAGYAASIGESTTNTNSEVEVVGLGAIASVNSDSNSMFTVNLDRLDAFKTISAQENSSATANGAATSTLSTNSFATQNSQRTASAFMQAFAANDEVSSN